jgi:hypothetical protein
MQDERDDRRADAVEHCRHRLKVAQVDIERAQRGDDHEVGEDERPAAGPRAPEAAAQIGNIHADLDGERPRQRLADGDRLAHLLLGKPPAFGHELALHLADQCDRPAEPEHAETQEIGHELGDAAARGRRCRIGRLDFSAVVRVHLAPSSGPACG